MYYNVMKVQKLIDTDNEKFNKKTLLETENGKLCAVAIKKDEIIDTHTSDRDAAILVIEGKVELHFDAEKFEVDKDEILFFKKDTEHKVVALKDSKFLIFRI